jgi:hypothetical protein
MVVMLHMVRHSVQHRNRRVDGAVGNARCCASRRMCSYAVLVRRRRTVSGQGRWGRTGYAPERALEVLRGSANPYYLVVLGGGTRAVRLRRHSSRAAPVSFSCRTSPTEHLKLASGGNARIIRPEAAAPTSSPGPVTPSSGSRVSRGTTHLPVTCTGGPGPADAVAGTASAQELAPLARRPAESRCHARRAVSRGRRQPRPRRAQRAEQWPRRPHHATGRGRTDLGPGARSRGGRPAQSGTAGVEQAGSPLSRRGVSRLLRSWPSSRRSPRCASCTATDRGATHR